MPSSESPHGKDTPGIPTRLAAGPEQVGHLRGIAWRPGLGQRRRDRRPRDAEMMTSASRKTASKAAWAAGIATLTASRYSALVHVETRAQRRQLALVRHLERRVAEEVAELEGALRLDDQLERVDDRDVARERRRRRTLGRSRGTRPPRPPASAGLTARPRRSRRRSRRRESAGAVRRHRPGRSAEPPSTADRPRGLSRSRLPIAPAGPTLSKVHDSVITPSRGIRPYVVRTPVTPENPAGPMVEPPVSVPSA